MRLGDLDALKEKLKNRYEIEQDEIDKGWNLGIGAAINLIDNAPTITPKLPTEVRKALEVLNKIEQNRWIPVSKGLPEEHVCDDGYHEPSEWVLVQTKNGHMYTSRYWSRGKKNVWTDLGYLEEVVAWQPLPAPYKKGGEE